MIYMSNAAQQASIEEVNDEKEHHELYDLFGRKVLNPVKGGIYIINGKKIIQ